MTCSRVLTLIVRVVVVDTLAAKYKKIYGSFKKYIAALGTDLELSSFVKTLTATYIDSCVAMGPQELDAYRFKWAELTEKAILTAHKTKRSSITDPDDDMVPYDEYLVEYKCEPTVNGHLCVVDEGEKYVLVPTSRRKK